MTRRNKHNNYVFWDLKLPKLRSKRRAVRMDYAMDSIDRWPILTFPVLNAHVLNADQSWSVSYNSPSGTNSKVTFNRSFISMTHSIFLLLLSTLSLRFLTGRTSTGFWCVPSKDQLPLVISAYRLSPLTQLTAEKFILLGGPKEILAHFLNV